MTHQHRLLLAASLHLWLLTSCSVDGGGYGPPPFQIQPQLNAVAVNSTTTFTASGSIDTSSAVWSLDTTPTTSQGSLSGTSGKSIVYTAPASPPIYATTADPVIQGRVALAARVPAQGGTVGDGLSLFITAPSITAGISPATATVALGGTVQFYAYAVGSTNNNVLYQINGVTGGSVATGTIIYPGLNPGLYTAPATMPTTGNTVTVTVVSVADPTKTASAIVTLH